MRFTGTGTQDSPIALDDSEDEVLHELYKQSSSPLELHHNIFPLPAISTGNQYEQRPPSPQKLKKRKRENSFSSQDIPGFTSLLPPPPQRSHPSLVNRLSQPETKKVRKRRQKLERQAAEEARLRNINWLNNAQFAAQSYSSFASTSDNVWTPEAHALYSEPAYIPPSSGSTSSSPFMHASTQSPVMHDIPSGPRAMLQDDRNHIASNGTYRSWGQTTADQPGMPSDWVSSMAMIAERSDYLPETQDLPGWTTLESEQASLHPPPTLQPPSYLFNNVSKPKSTSPTMQRASSPKPPSQIGMLPDQDPNSKHGTFGATASMKDVGSDMKNRKSPYIPNPACTLVMEQIPKVFRNADYINKWSRSVCGSLPIHAFIDSSAGKALLEFATAELARKAWASPKLGSALAAFKSHQLKGKPREDQIKVWWYRVDGVGANSGVGEIEEGEIEGDVDKVPDSLQVPVKETKKERKARLAREREKKRAIELELAKQNAKDQKARLARERERKKVLELESEREDAMKGVVQQQLAKSLPTNSPLERHSISRPAFNMHIPPLASTSALHPVNSHISAQPPTGPRYPSLPTHPASWGVQHPSVLSHPHPPRFANTVVNKTAYGSSLYLRDANAQDDDESIASSAGRSPSPPPPVQQSTEEKPGTNNGASQDMVVDDYEEADMDVDLDDEPSELISVPHENPSNLPPPSNLPMQSIAPLSPPVIAPPPMPPLAHQQRPPLHSSLPPRPTPLTTSLGNQKFNQKPLPQSSVTAPPFIPKQPHPILPPTRSQALQPAQQVQHLDIVNQQRSVARLEQAPIPALSSVTTTTSTLRPNTSFSSTAISSDISAVPDTKSTNASNESASVKRSLLARQKELEERIAKTKLEIAGGPTATKAEPPTSVSTIQTKPSMNSGEKQALEDKLRELVLKSRGARGAVKSDLPTNPPSPIIIPVAASVTPNAEVKASDPPSLSSVSAPTSNGVSLEDLAISFITETIDTIKAQPVSAPQPAKAAPQVHVPQSEVQRQLVEKQRRLEQHIAESKALMEKFAKCSTKAEKDNMLKVMREHTRCVVILCFVSLTVLPSSFRLPLFLFFFDLA
ncbi:hypothetical protein CPC08DRAFT_703430 [Agrocybe pediades]|nr:hypothetical protein CPC08DRAFT_703430 [Agrocybe pediades]